MALNGPSILALLLAIQTEGKLIAEQRGNIPKFIVILWTNLLTCRRKSQAGNTRQCREEVLRQFAHTLCYIIPALCRAFLTQLMAPGNGMVLEIKAMFERAVYKQFHMSQKDRRGQTCG